mgnify:CR=1 FL=1
MTRSMPELIGILMDRVQTAAELTVAADVEVPTGLDALDHAIGGLRSGDLILLIGAPGCGKSSLAVSLIRHVVLDAGCPAVFASLQSKGEHVLLKIISGATRISLRNLGAGKLTEQDWLVLADMTSLLAAAPLMVCDGAIQNPQSLDADVLASTERFGRCAFLAIDHSQLLSPMSAASDESIQVAALRELCRELKLLARRRDCAVLLIESSNLGGAVVDFIPEADVILELRRTGLFSKESGAERCEVGVLKQQMGPPCTVLVQFSPAFGGFNSLGR